MKQLEIRERLENIKQEADSLDVLESMSKEIKLMATDMMQGFADSYDSEKTEEAREWIRKLQFMQKAKKEINGRTAELEDELMG